MSPFLISKEKLVAVTGHETCVSCSLDCRGEIFAREEYRFLDEGRFLLSCGHYSLHIQCLLSYMVYKGNALNGLQCPIQDTHKCRGERKKDVEGGILHYWTQKEYHAFITAFLRNRTLVDAFIDK